MPLAASAADPRVRRWLYLVATITFCLIVVGGFVRLTRSGLSIVEWNPIAGALPPAAAELHRLLLQLNPDARAVMILRYQEDLDPAEDD